MSIRTTYFKYLTTEGESCIEPPEPNYTPYNLFCLHTQIYPVIMSLLGKNSGIRFESKHHDNKLYVYIIPIKEGERIKLTVFQKDLITTVMNEATTVNKLNFCVLITADLKIISRYGIIPYDYKRSILEYINIEEKYNPYIRDGHVYINLIEEENYDKIYNEILINVMTQISTFYEKGYILHCDRIKDNWRLISQDEDRELFSPNWWDERIFKYQSPVEFFMNLLDNNFIEIEVGYDMLIRHYISIKLINDKFAYKNSKLRCQIDSYEELKKLLGYIEYVNSFKGNVITLPCSSFEQVEMYTQVAQKYIDQTKEIPCIGYSVIDSTYPVIFSCLIEKGLDGNVVIRNILDDSLFFTPLHI
jgi:hypothetical protein